MASLPEGALLRTLLGSGKGDGAAAAVLVIAGAAVLVCLAFSPDRACGSGGVKIQGSVIEIKNGAAGKSAEV